jgi:hypothetical protein
MNEGKSKKKFRTLIMDYHVGNNPKNCAFYALKTFLLLKDQSPTNCMMKKITVCLSACLFLFVLIRQILCDLLRKFKMAFALGGGGTQHTRLIKDRVVVRASWGWNQRM